jgi:hypothetical protein
MGVLEEVAKVAEQEAVAGYRRMYPALSESEAVMAVAIMADYPHWEVWPMVGYPGNHWWYTRRLATDMPNPVKVVGLAEIPTTIDGWIAAHASALRYSGQATR